jgi:hypothetical protein
MHTNMEIITSGSNIDTLRSISPSKANVVARPPSFKVRALRKYMRFFFKKLKKFTTLLIWYLSMLVIGTEVASSFAGRQFEPQQLLCKANCASRKTYSIFKN